MYPRIRRQWVRKTCSTHTKCDMAAYGRNKFRREFNPFNLSEKHTDNKYHIKFERLGSYVRTKPLWWFLLVFMIVIFVYLYLTNRY